MNDAAIRERLAALISTGVANTPAERVEGGSSDRCLRYQTDKGPVFVKVADKNLIERFAAEAAGLEELRAVQAIRVPVVLGIGVAEEHAILALEWLDLRASTPNTDAMLGEQLAQLHRVKKPLYGWNRGNYIGATMQPNVWSRDWLHFWRTHRFDVQLDLAAANGADARFLERATLLSALMDGFFVSYIPDASLLHGDLWSGNAAADVRGRPVVFDPAVYYGDRECDLAMTQLFGGFGQAFYAAYRDAWPLDAGSDTRVDLYNLYHVLNHFNLFGGGYLAQAERMANRLLAELGH